MYSPQEPCPTDFELSDLLDGKVVDPLLTDLNDHLEACSLCQQRVSLLSPQGTLAAALRGEPTAFERIANETPSLLVERIKLIPMLEGDYSESRGSQSGSSISAMDSVPFSVDPTPGGLGKLGTYRILKLLGSGGMGSVFLAEDTKLNRQVALKVMLPKIAADPVAKQRFHREARAAASLKSEHIVTVHQVDEVDNVPYLAMELLVGRSLDEVIQSGEALSAEAIVDIALGVAKGLADAHEKGLIHRDIKPGNIWVECGEDGLPRAKILDFGLARMEVDESHLTHASTIVGTPAFMAPEQARGDKSADARADLFSLGCVVYYMCTGDVPFKAESILGTLTALAVNTPNSPADQNAAIPVKLSRLTMQLLEKEPSKRPPSAREVATVLKEVRSELETGTATYAIAGSSTEVLQVLDSKRRQRVQSVWIAIAVCLFVVAGLVALAAWLGPPQQFASSEREHVEVTPDVDRTAVAEAKENAITSRINEDFRRANPNFEGTLRPFFEANGDIVGLVVAGVHVANLDALQGLNSLRTLTIEGGSTWNLTTIDVSGIQELSLTNLGLYGGYVVANVEPLQGMPLKELELDYSAITDLTPLAGMPLQKLLLWNWAGHDLTPLRGMPLKDLNIGGNRLPMDLGPLADSPLEFLCLNMTKVSDLSPLSGLKTTLKRLYCSNSLVSDLSPLREASIEELLIEGTLVRDISIAEDWPLTWIEFDYEIANWVEVLKSISTLQRIKDRPAATVIAEFDPSQWPKPKATFVSSTGIEFALVPHGKTLRSAGNFSELLVGPDIEIPNDFYLARCEVTQEQWYKVMGNKPSYFSRGGPGADKVSSLSDAELAQLPVERVSWLDCQQFLAKLNELENDGEWVYRLPTEAEWLFACQGGPMPTDFDPTNTFYFAEPTKTLLSHKASTLLSGRERPCRVGLYAPNSLGLFDMHGNVWEWCDDLANIPGKRARWIHSGSWKDSEEKCRAAHVLEPTEPWTYYDLGLRVARVRKDP